MPFLLARHVARSEFAVVEILIQTLNRRDSIVTRNRVPGECAGQISCKSDLNLSSPLSRDNLHPLPSTNDLIRPNTSHLSHGEKSFLRLFPFVAIDLKKKKERVDVETIDLDSNISKRFFLCYLSFRDGKSEDGGLKSGSKRWENFSNNFEHNRSLAADRDIQFYYRISVNCVRRSF